ncbi:MAG: hypothetical protein KGI54_16060 [Pseudomonadota bacterium]|nr:hypothetical protein [Pseudomonadota bacterium]
MSASQPGKRKNDGLKSGVTPPAKRASNVGVSYSQQKPPASFVSSNQKSYAAAATRAVEDSYPYMLSVYTGRQERVPLSEDNFSILTGRLRKRVLDYGKVEGHVQLQTAFIQLSAKGAGKIACKNAETATWYSKVVSEIDIGGTTFRAWSRDDIGELRQIRLVTKGLNGMIPDEVIELARLYTPGFNGRMDYLRTETTVGNKEMFVFGIDDQVAHCLSAQEEPWVLNLGTDLRRVQYAGKKELQERVTAASLADQMETTLGASTSKTS